LQLRDSPHAPRQRQQHLYLNLNFNIDLNSAHNLNPILNIDLKLNNLNYHPK
jgi:hypothetical protein